MSMAKTRVIATLTTRLSNAAANSLALIRSVAWMQSTPRAAAETKTPQWTNVSCTPLHPPNGQCESFNDYVPADNGNCCFTRGASCISGDDCCGSLVCDDNTCEPF
jgi:hypothetical protein